MEFTLINPIMLKIFLYRNDYTDRMIISELKKMNCIYLDPSTTASFYVKKEDMAHVVRDVFQKDLAIQKSLPVDRLSVSASSLYFIDSLIEQYQRLKHFHVLTLDDENFTRLIDKEINFDYRIDLSKIDLSIAIEQEHIHHFQRVFKAIGVYDHTQPYYNRAPYFEIFTRDLIQKLELYLANFEEGNDEHSNIKSILSYFTNKLQYDNSQLLIIMER